MAPKSQQASKKESKRVNWTPKMEQYFVRLMQRAIEDGKGSDCNFKQAVMNEILKKFNTKLKMEVTYRQLRDKLDAFKRSCKELTLLMKQSGFGWDEDTHTVDTTPEVWGRQHEAHGKTYKKWEGKEFPVYLDLVQLFEGSVATGKHAIAPTQIAAPANNQQPLS